jgi:hypothetical protein
MQASRAIYAGCRAYRCPVCTRWHAGHRTALTDLANAERVALVRQIRAAGNGWLIGWLADQWETATRADRIVWKTRDEVRA